MENCIFEIACLFITSYKLWHYTGSLVANVPVKDNQELWEVMWKPVPEGTFPEKPVQYKSSQAEPAAGGYYLKLKFL